MKPVDDIVTVRLSPEVGGQLLSSNYLMRNLYVPNFIFPTTHGVGRVKMS